MGSASLRDGALDEQQPLLQQQTLAPHQTHQQIPLSRWAIIWQRIIPKFDVVSPRYQFVPLLGCLIILINESEYTFKQVALIRAIEALHCIEYYEKHNPDIAELGKHIPERLCKADEIQKNVATSTAMYLLVRMLCALIGNLLLGWVADTKGRKLVLSMHKVSMVCSVTLQVLWYMLYPKVPIWALYLSGLPGLIGGTFDLGLVMLFVSYNDVMISETQKTTLFFLTTSMQYPAQAVGPLVSGVLMDLNGQGNTPEVAFFVALASTILCAILTIFFFPETLGESRKAWAVISHKTANNNDADDGNKGIRGMQGKLERKICTIWHNTQTSVRGVGMTNMFLLSLSILAAGIGSKSIDWFALVQYPVIKFHWKFSQATTAVSLQAIITMINFAVLLPFYTGLGTQRLGFSSARTSLIIMLFSTFLLIVGSVIIGFSATVPVFFLGLLIYTLGGGLAVATQVYISSLSDKQNLARTLGSLSMVTTIGKALASAIFPKVMAAGLDDGRDWMKGLPLFTSACLFVVAGLAIVIVATITGEKTAEQVDGESEERS